jgi:hypothetical protein
MNIYSYNYIHIYIEYARQRKQFDTNPRYRYDDMPPKYIDINTIYHIRIFIYKLINIIEYARQRKQFDTNPRYRYDNIASLELDMPDKTTQVRPLTPYLEPYF